MQDSTTTCGGSSLSSKSAFHRFLHGPHFAPTCYTVIYVITIAVLLVLAYFFLERLPSLPAEYSLSAGDFNPYNAYKVLENLTAMGDRPVGSPENEQLAPELLMQHLASIQRYIERVHAPLVMTAQMVRSGEGEFFLSRGESGRYLFYDKLGMVVVHVKPSSNEDNAPTLLVNSHYDSVVTSPGTIQHFRGSAS